MDEKKQMEKRLPYFHGEPEGDPYGLLAVTIVVQAIEDWRYLVKKRAWENDAYLCRQCNFDELRNFFRGDWCAMLLTKTEFEGERILELLEDELQTAMRQPEKKGRKRKK